jgi:hypothetical protein
MRLSGSGLTLGGTCSLIRASCGARMNDNFLFQNQRL